MYLTGRCAEQGTAPDLQNAGGQRMDFKIKAQGRRDQQPAPKGTTGQLSASKTILACNSAERQPTRPKCAVGAWGPVRPLQGEEGGGAY